MFIFDVARIHECSILNYILLIGYVSLGGSVYSIKDAMAHRIMQPAQPALADDDNLSIGSSTPLVGHTKLLHNAHSFAFAYASLIFCPRDPPFILLSASHHGGGLHGGVHHDGRIGSQDDMVLLIKWELTRLGCAEMERDREWIDANVAEKENVGY